METGYYPSPISPVQTRVGWIGAGTMGAAMATRVLQAGYKLAVYTRTPSKAAPLYNAGAANADSPAAIGRSSAVVFLTVGHPSEVSAVAFTVISSLSPNSVLVDCSSTPPSLARKLYDFARSRKCFAIDAPVSGGEAGARDGLLAILAGGDQEIVTWLKPLFQILGNVTFMGGPGSGQSAKIANQILVSANLLGLSEAIAFAKAAGLNEIKFLEGVKEGEAFTAVTRLFGEKVAKRELEPGAYAEYMVKDLGMAMDGGDGVEMETDDGVDKCPAAAVVVMPGAALCRQLFQGMVANGDGKKLGIHGLITVIERISGKI